MSFGQELVDIHHFWCFRAKIWVVYLQGTIVIITMGNQCLAYLYHLFLSINYICWLLVAIFTTTLTCFDHFSAVQKMIKISTWHEFCNYWNWCWRWNRSIYFIPCGDKCNMGGVLVPWNFWFQTLTVSRLYDPTWLDTLNSLT